MQTAGHTIGGLRKLLQVIGQAVPHVLNILPFVQAACGASVVDGAGVANGEEGHKL